MDRWPLSPTGLLLDREFAVVDPVSGKALTQKSHPELAACRPHIDLASMMMTISAPNKGHISVSIVEAEEEKATHANGLDPSSSTNPVSIEPDGVVPDVATKDRNITVCVQTRQATCMDEAVGAWFSELLNVPCVFVRRKSDVACNASDALPSGSISNAPGMIPCTKETNYVLKETYR